MKKKKCSVCRIIKNVKCFTVKKSHSDGLNSCCKTCRKEESKKYFDKNKSKINEKAKVARDNNKPEYARKRKEYREKNIDRIRQMDRERKRSGLISTKEYQKLYRFKNKARSAKYMKEYMENNPDVFMASNAKRRSSKLERTPPWFEFELVSGLYKKASELRIAGEDVHVDHVVPLQGDLVSGLHCFSNLQILSAYKNRSKGNSYNVNQGDGRL